VGYFTPTSVCVDLALACGAFNVHTRLDHGVTLDFKKRTQAGKAGASILTTYRHSQHRHRPPPRPTASCVCEKPMEDAAVSFVGLLSKSFVLRLAHADQPTVDQLLKPDVQEFGTKALEAFLAALLCPSRNRRSAPSRR